MTFTNVRELHINTAKVLKQVKKEKRIIVTNRGKPQAIITAISEDQFARLALLSESLIASESALKKDWMQPEEDKAWKDL